MAKKEASIQSLEAFLPPNTFAGVLEYLQVYKVHLTVARERRSILGDYRHRTPHHAHRISVNGNLNPYAFLITLLHELAHLLAQFRAGRRRIPPHGAQWRRACADLGIAGEARCHNLPFPIRRQARRYVYSCPNCELEFPRTRPLRRTSACHACCRAFNRGKYDPRFRLQVRRSLRAR